VHPGVKLCSARMTKGFNAEAAEDAEKNQSERKTNAGMQSPQREFKAVAIALTLNLSLDSACSAPL